MWNKNFSFACCIVGKKMIVLLKKRKKILSLKTDDRVCRLNLNFYFSSLPKQKVTEMGLCVCAQLWLTLCNPMNCSPPGSSVHGNFQARILEHVATSCTRRSSWLTDGTFISFLYSIGRDSLPLSHLGWYLIRETFSNTKTLKKCISYISFLTELLEVVLY